jgi:hypothetical protein
MYSNLLYISFLNLQQKILFSKSALERNPSILQATPYKYSTYTVKKVIDILVPSPDVTYQTLPGRE